MYRLAKLTNYKTLLTLVAGIAMTALLVPAALVQATSTTDLECGGQDSDDPFCIDVMSGETGLGEESLPVTIARIINVALGLLGVVTVVIILAGGFKYMTAGGNDEKTGEARKLIFAGIIGLVIILSAYAIAKFVLDSLETATGVESTDGGV
jgi:hypothetical protein